MLASVMKAVFVVVDCYYVKGVDVVCCGDAEGWVMWLMDLFGGCASSVCRAVSVEYDAGACSRKSIWVMCARHVGWTRIKDSIGPLGSLRGGVFAGSSSVV